MATITVTTAADIVNANDGVTSLREAIAAAGGQSSTEILFAPSVFASGLGNTTIAPIILTERLVISAGMNITIDGSLLNPTANAAISGGTSGQNLITVQAGATLTLRDITLRDSAVSGGTSADGTPGTDGAAGTDGPFSSGLPGTDGSNGGSGISPGGSGNEVVAGILNNGALTLERVDFTNLTATGGNGGRGGNGGDGGRGGNGTYDDSGPSAIRPGSGDGGDGGDGLAGGAGGIAAGAVLNRGTLVVRDVSFVNTSVAGGKGGEGGTGGVGGVGGASFTTIIWGAVPDSKQGDGGDGGDGGRGGDGGSAAGAIYNLGTVTYESAVGAPLSVTSTGGQGGLGGQGGNRGNISDNSNTIPESPGTNGANGFNGTAGAGNSFLFTAPTIATTFIVSAVRTRYADTGNDSARTITLYFEALGQTGAGRTVQWGFTGGDGITASDFIQTFDPSGNGNHVLGLPTGGTIDFGTNGTGRTVNLTLAADGVDEQDETFTITLSNPTGGQVGWSQSIEFTIGALPPAPINGTPGNDLNLLGTSGDDEINGLGGNDKLTGAAGRDTLDGGSGNDTYVLAAEPTGTDTIIDTSGIDTITSTISRSLLPFATIENLQLLGSGNISGTGNTLANTLTGNSGKNKLDGGSGNDKLDGSSGNDTLLGGSGNDTLIGGAGKDSMTGGSGNDRFVFSSATHSAVGSNRDVITDFSTSGSSERIDLSAFSGTFVFRGKDGAFSSSAKEISYSALGSNTLVKIDLDGDAGAEMEILLVGRKTLSASDFYL